jgi:hypothetical protein
MKIKKIVSSGILLLSILLSVVAEAQDSLSFKPLDTIASFDIFDKLAETGEGKVILGGDNVKAIVNDVKIQKPVPLKGWRIRIFRDNSQAASRKAERIKSDIASTFPGLPVYITHNSPNFYVEVGDYRTRDDAEKMRRLLIPAYPGASAVQGTINFPPL